MATDTTFLKLKKPAVGGDTNTWGALLNADLDQLDTLFEAYGRVPYYNTNGGVSQPVKLSIAVKTAGNDAYIVADGDNHTAVLSGTALNAASNNIRAGLIAFKLNDPTVGAEKGQIQLFTKSPTAGQVLAVNIDSAQRAQMGKAISNYNCVLEIEGNRTANGIGISGCNNPLAIANNDFLIQFLNNSNVEIGKIFNNGSSVVYNTTSDKRLKTNVQPLQDVGGIIDAIAPVTYNWKHVEGATGVGFLAQDLAKVIPEAVTAGDDNEVLSFENPDAQIWGVDLAKIVPYLVAEIQQLRHRVATLEQEKTG